MNILEDTLLQLASDSLLLNGARANFKSSPIFNSISDDAAHGSETACGSRHAESELARLRSSGSTIVGVLPAPSNLGGC